MTCHYRLNIAFVHLLTVLLIYLRTVSPGTLFQNIMLGFLLGWLNCYFYHDQMKKYRALRI